jgi:hypothetical protein
VQGTVQRGDNTEAFACFAGPPPGDDNGQVTTATIFIGERATPVDAG